MARRSKLDTEIQRLYGLPLGEFTGARNALTKQLRKDGKKDDAEEVASLPKPTVSAWAVNHLFTVEPGKMDELLESGDRARKALQQILSGGDPGALRDAIQEARDLANRLRDRAVDVLSEDGRKPGQAIVDRIATNLQSLAFSPAAEPVIQRGWLDVDLPPPGFEVLAGLQLAALPARAKKEKPAPRPQIVPDEKPRPAEPVAQETPKKKEEKEDKETVQLRERRDREEAKARERADRVEARQRERLAKVQARREEAAGRADFLRRKAEQAERAAEEARERAEEAESIAADARKRADDAERVLAKADKALEAARG
jgi:hypothetical protein